MVKKKHLRAEAHRLAAEVDRQRLAAEILRQEREVLHDRLLDAGLIRVAGPRTPADRLRAARAGVIVLDDVQLLSEPQQTVEIIEPSGTFLFQPASRTQLGRAEHRIALEFTGEPETMQALAAALGRRP